MKTNEFSNGTPLVKSMGNSSKLNESILQQLNSNWKSIYCPMVSPWPNQCEYVEIHKKQMGTYWNYINSSWHLVKFPIVPPCRNQLESIENERQCVTIY